MSLVADHGVEYLLAATILAGVLQATLAALGVAKVMRFVPRSVMTGFVNALAILILLAQLPHLAGGGPGFFGGMAGCAMAGCAMINVRVSNARTRLSTFSAGLFLIVLVVGLGGLVAIIPMAALVAVMVLVAVSTFDWHSVAPATLRRMPAGETLIMVVTVAATVATHNLAIGVGAGVLTAMVLFARRVVHLVDVERCVDPDGSTCMYSVTGELFFASDQEFIEAFEYADDPPSVIIDMSRAHVWDASAVAALDAIERHYARHDIAVEITGLNSTSHELHSALSGRFAVAH